MSPISYRIGNTRVHLISDGIYWTDGGGVFGLVPHVLWERVIQPDALNRIPMDLRCLLIESSEGLILVDSGYGGKLPAKRLQQLNLTSEMRLLDDLAAAGFAAADVRMVINTHLHGDHCGGNTLFDPDGQIVPTFPNATYLMQRLELADATYPNERTPQPIWRRISCRWWICAPRTAARDGRGCSTATPRSRRRCASR